MRKFAFILFLFLSIASNAQNSLGGIGQWRGHYDNHQIRSVVQGDVIYAASPYQIIKFDDKQNPSWIDKSTGLHDIGITNLAWDPINQQLIVVYGNSNLDIIKGDQVYNINAIQRSNLYINKQINALSVFGNWGLLSTQFGIVVVDLSKHEIKDTWFPNNNQISTNTYDVAIHKDSIYAATENGIWVNSIGKNGPNPNGWQKLTQLDSLAIQHFVQDPLKIYGYNNSKLIALPDSQPLFILPSGKLSQVTKTANSFQVAVQYANQKGALIHILPDFSTKTIIDSLSLSSPVQSLLDKDNFYWIADSTKGLLWGKTNMQWLTVGGPNAALGGIAFMNARNLIAPYGAQQKGYASLTEQGWKNFELINNIPLPNLYAATELKLEDQIWFTSNNKLVQIKNNNSVEWIQPNTLPGNYTYIQTDINNNIWVIQDQQGLVRYKNNTWSSLPVPNSFGSRGLNQFIVTKQGQAWVVAPNQQGVYIYQSTDYYTTETWKQLTPQPNNGNLSSSKVTSINEDLTGNIWVGTDNGIGILNCGDIATEPCNAYLPIVRNNGFNGYLFQNETIHCITTDGANRKWIGTNKGAWLLSPDGLEVLTHFTKDNSPLPSDTVTQILIEPTTGEIFFKAMQQLVSFRGTATEGATSQNTIQIFPNPVSSSFMGNIAFRGLVNNAIVKITDLTGKLLFQTTALGGQAIWNGRTYEGHKVASGIYLVFVRDLTGSEQAVGKIVIADGY